LAQLARVFQDRRRSTERNEGDLVVQRRLRSCKTPAFIKNAPNRKLTSIAAGSVAGSVAAG